MPWWFPVAVLAVLAVLMFAGLVWARQISKDNSPVSKSVIRGAIAIDLVVGLILLAAMVLGGSDSDLRNLVIGGVLSGAASAVAFFFATKGNEDATLLSTAGKGGKKGGAPPITLTKAVSRDGDELNFVFMVTNTGAKTLKDVKLISSLLHPKLAWPSSMKQGVLKPGESVSGSDTHQITAADKNAQAVKDTTLAAGEFGSGRIVTSDPESSSTQVS